MNIKRLVGTVVWCIGIILYLPILFTVATLLFPFVKNGAFGAGLIVLTILLTVLWVGLLIGTMIGVSEGINPMDIIQEYFPKEAQEDAKDPTQADWR